MIPTCIWQTGTVYTGPRTCGRPAKFTVESLWEHMTGPVCGIHARSAERRLAGKVEPLS